MPLELSKSTVLPIDVLSGPLETLVDAVVEVCKNGHNRDIRIAEIVNDRECYIIQLKARLEIFHQEIYFLESQLIKDHELLMYKVMHYASELNQYNSIIFNTASNDDQRRIAQEMHEATALRLENLKRPELQVTGNTIQSIQYWE